MQTGVIAEKGQCCENIKGNVWFWSRDIKMLCFVARTGFILLTAQLNFVERKVSVCVYGNGSNISHYHMDNSE